MAVDKPRRGVSQVKRQRAKELRQQQTEEEFILWECLRHNQLDGLRFRRQEPLAGFIADFYCHAARLVVEVDGGVHTRTDQAEYDAARDEILARYGLRVIRFANIEIRTNLADVQERIAQACALAINANAGMQAASSPPSPVGKAAGGLGS